jgi:acyl-CoA thioester hydrolase
MNIRIYYEDTDMGGIVYHSNYLKYCERARSELFFSAGRSPMINGCHFAIKNIEADFVKPAFLGDMLSVQTKVLKIKNASLRLFHEIKREDDLIFRMSVNLVFLSQEGKIGRIPQETKEFFKLFK